MKSFPTLLAAIGCSTLLGFAVFACTTSGESTPVENNPVTTTAGVQVSGDVISVTLGDDCPKSSGVARCAPSESADFAPGGCGGCQQTNMQILFTAGAGNAGAKIEVVSVTLHDANSDAKVDTLTARDPSVWNGTGYVTWDEVVKPSAETKASYNLSAPKWSDLGNSYSQKYKVRVTLKVDGSTMTIESAPLNREPQVVT